MMNWLRILIAEICLLSSAAPGFANFAMSPSGGTTLFAIDGANQGTGLCAVASTECGATVPINTAGAPLFTSGAPGLVTLTGTNNINNIGGTVSLPTGAATSALQTTGNTALTTINTTLGTPFQAGGSIGNTTFGATLAAETTKVIGTVRSLGNAGAITDFAGQNAASPANAWLMGGQFQTTPTTITPGNASPLQLDNAGNLRVNVATATGLAQGSTTSGQTGSLVMGAASTNAPTATTGDTWPLSISPASGGVRIDLKDTASNTNSFLVNVASGGIASGAITSGAVASGAYASGALASGSIASGAMVDLVAEQTPIAAASATATKALAIGGQYDSTQKTLSNGQQGSIALSPRAAMFVAVGADGFVVTNAGTFATQANLVPATTGGLTNFVLEPGASDNHSVIKNGAGQVYGIHVFNNSATVNYGRLYNAGTGFNGCNSATNLAYEFHIPASTSDAGFVVPIPQGLAFATGISLCVTSAYGQTNTTSATATAMSLNVLYN